MRPAWVTNQIANLLRHFCASSNQACVGVSDRQWLSGVPAQDVNRDGPRRFGGRMELWPDLPIAKGFLWRPDGAGQMELWLDPRLTDYRATFERFARRYLGAAGLSGADVQIDHVFPKATAKRDDLAYVRMLAIPPASNMAAGRTVERAMADRAAMAPGRKAIRWATYMSIGKAAGYAGWDSLPDSTDPAANAAAVAGLFAYLRGFGLPPDVLTALDEQLTAYTLTKIR